MSDKPSDKPHDPKQLRDTARRYRQIADEHDAEGSVAVAQKMREAATELEAQADKIERGADR
jgi:hypothetical protein